MIYRNRLLSLIPFLLEESERDLGVTDLKYESIIRLHPSPLPVGEGTRILAPFSLGRRVGDEGKSYLDSATLDLDFLKSVSSV
jgi:hypothetical protein